FNYADNKDQSIIVLNGDNLEERLKTNTNFFDSKVVDTTKPTDKKVWIIAVRFISEETPQNYNVNQFVYHDLFNQNAEAVKQQAAYKMTFYGFEAKYLDPRATGHLTEWETGVEFRYDDLTTLVLFIDNGNEILPD